MSGPIVCLGEFSVETAWFYFTVFGVCGIIRESLFTCVRVYGVSTVTFTAATFGPTEQCLGNWSHRRKS
jgi:hypothetical protein